MKGNIALLLALPEKVVLKDLRQILTTHKTVVSEFIGVEVGPILKNIGDSPNNASVYGTSGVQFSQDCRLTVFGC